MKPIVGAAACAMLGVCQIALACAVSAVLGRYLYGSFPIPNSDYTAQCGLGMTSTSVCTAAFVSTAFTLCLCLIIIGMQCAAADGQTRYGFAGPLLSLLGFVWWAAYGAAATSAANTGNQLDPSLTSYRTAVVAISWCTMGLFIPSFLVSAMTVSAAARASAKLTESLNGSSRRFSQPASPPVSPCKSNKSFGSAYEPFKESDSPKKWVQPHNAHSKSFAVTSDGLRTLLVVAGQPVPLSPSPSLTHSPSVSPTRSPTARSPVHHSLTPGNSFTNILLPQHSQDLSGHH